MQEALKQQIFKESAAAAAVAPPERQQPDRHAYEKVGRVATGSAVVLFSTSDCCMCHVAKRLLFSLGVAPTVVEFDRLDADDAGDFRAVLSSIAGGHSQQPLPAVFVGGKLLGGVESLMACHINGSLVPLLKEAGALWL